MNYIYKITDKTNGKCYIGQAKNVFSRWSTHCKPESADAARYIINNESINLQVRTVQKRLSSDLKFEHYTVIEYYIE